MVYIPPAPPEEEEEIFKTIQQGINFDNYDSIAVEVTGRDPVQPITSFQEAALYETFKSNVEKAKYIKPTPVQKYSIPAILAGRDLMACAQTGSGKTVSEKGIRILDFWSEFKESLEASEHSLRSLKLFILVLVKSQNISVSKIHINTFLIEMRVAGLLKLHQFPL